MSLLVPVLCKPPAVGQGCSLPRAARGWGKAGAEGGRYSLHHCKLRQSAMRGPRQLFMQVLTLCLSFAWGFCQLGAHR